MSDRDKCPACNDFCQLWVGGECVGKDDEGQCHLYETPNRGVWHCRPQVGAFVPLRPLCEAYTVLGEGMRTLIHGQDHMHKDLTNIMLCLGRIEVMIRIPGQ